MISLKEANVAVLGLGKSGLAATEVLLGIGAKVSAFDPKTTALEAAEKQLPAAKYVEAQDPQTMAEKAGELADIIVISPGIPASHPVYSLAQARGIPIWSEIELAWQIQQNHTDKPDTPWLTITGTNGKTTTTGMTAAILQANGEKAIAVGNIGVPVVGAVAEGKYDCLAVEMSSFQLHTTYSVSAQAAICLNLDTDHIDWHGSLTEYHAAKAKIYEHTQVAAVYNQAQPQTLKQVLAADVVEGCRAVGITTGTPDIWQIGIVEDLLVDRAFGKNIRKEAQALASFADIAHLCGTNPSPVLLEDTLAAAALCRAHGVDPEAVAAGLREFQLAPHRREIVGRQTGVTWINDSKATNAHAAEKSLSGCRENSVVWIAGGDDKGQDFTDLVEKVAACLRGVILIGVERERMRKALAEKAPQVPVVELEPHEDLMFSVVNEAVALSLPGDEVILAPACASWDQFENYQQRGTLFAQAVARLEE